MNFRPRSRHLVLVAITLVSGLAVSRPAKADAISYELDFDRSSGPTVSNGSFQFDSMASLTTKINDANFLNLQAFVGKILYTGTSASDDFARVNKNGVVKGLFADLEPADNSSSDVLQLYGGKHHRYKLFDSTMDVLGSGTYELEVETKSVPEPSTLLLLSAGLLALIGAKRKVLCA